MIKHFHSVRIVIYAGREWRLRAPDSSVRKARCLYTRIVPRGYNRIRGTGRSERVGSGIRVGGGDGDGNRVENGDVNGDGDGDGTGTGTGTRVEANEGV